MTEPPTFKLTDIEDAMMFVSSGFMFDSAAWACRTTGEVLWHGGDRDDFEPLPADIDDEDRYIAIPDKRDLGLGKPLALEFARAHLPENFDQVREMFAHRGAYAPFKDLLDRLDSLDAWYQWEQDQTRQALREWCADNGIKLVE